MAQPHILVVYQSMDGHTERIAERIGDELRTAGAQVTMSRATAAPAPVDVDVVVLGDSIHAGQYSKELIAYVEGHLAALNALPTALFQVCLTSAGRSREAMSTTGGYVAALTESTGLEPALVARFPGALPYTRYGRMKRALMRRIAAKGGQPTDTSKDHDFTDWDEVAGFAADLLELGRPATV